MALGFGGTVVARARAVLEADTRDLDRGLARSEKRWQGYHKVAVGAALGVIAGAAAMAKGAIDAASAVGEQVSKNNVIFKGAGADVVKWAETVVDSAGISKRAALEATGVLGNMLTPMGIAPRKAAAMSKSLVQLAGDMASFNDASPEEVLAAMQSGLAGEAEPLRRFGVFLNADKVAAEALRLGLVKTTKDVSKVGDASTRVELAQRKLAETTKKHGKDSAEARAALVALHTAERALSKELEGKVPKLTDAQKAQATYSVVLRETSAAQGDFARTSSSAANQERKNAAEVENLKAKIGAGLLPAYQGLLTLVGKVVEWMSKHTTTTKILIGVIVGLAAAILTYSAAVKVATVATKLMTASQTSLNVAQRASVIGLIVTALVALGAALIFAYQKSETFKKIVTGAFDAVQRAVEATVGFVKEHWKTAIFLALTGPFGAAYLLITKHFDAIKRLAIRTALAVVEPFTHIDLGMFDWARELKDKLHRELAQLDKDDSSLAETAGRAWGVVYGKGAVAGARSVWGDTPFLSSLIGAARRGKGDGVLAAQGGWPGLSSPVGTGGLKGMILDDLALAQRMGLALTSGARPGAVTSTGRPSLHGVGQAIDVAGPAGAMAMFAQAVASRPGIAEVIYTPVGAWYPGVGWTRPSGQIAADHYDHVHVGARGDGLVGVGDGLATATMRIAGALYLAGGGGIRLPFTGDGKETPARRALRLRSEAMNKTPAMKLAKSKAAWAAVAKSKATIETKAQRAAETADRTSSAAARAGDRARREWELRAAAAATPEAAALGQRLAVQAQIGATQKDLAAKKSKYAALRAAAADARRKGFPGLAASLERQAADVRQDILDQQLTIRELTAQRDAIKPEQAASDPGGSGDSGGVGADAGFDVGSFAGGDQGVSVPAGPSAEEIEAQVRERVASESAAVLGARSRFLSDFAPNIFRLGAGGLVPGSGPAQQTTVFQTTFTKPPEDPFVWLSRVQFAARR